MAELVDAMDSKSIVRKDVRVRVSLPAPVKNHHGNRGLAKSCLARDEDSSLSLPTYSKYDVI
jgi:hypothetical protein